MTSDLRRAGRLLFFPTIAFIAAVVFVPGRLELVVRVYGLVLAAVALVVVLADLRRAYPPSTGLRPTATADARREHRPPALAQLEQHAFLGVAGAFDLHYRLRPHVRSLAVALLATRRGASLDARPDDAKAILGDATWELARTDRPRPADRMASGIAPAQLAHVVESLERL